MLTGRFFEATLGSSLKNSLPSTRIFDTSLPLAVILPSELTSTPGRRFSRSSTTALGWVLYVSAANSTVSCITFMGVRMPSTTASLRVVALSSSSIFLTRISASFTVTSRAWGVLPTYSARRM